MSNESFMSKIFAVIYTPGPAWDADKPIWDQELQLHDDYLHSLFLAGKLREGGPFSDSGGGIAILEVETESEARQIIRDDPALIDGIYTARMHPWFPIDWGAYQPSS